MMYGHEKSRSAIVAGKPTNKAERSAAELVERRAETKGNAGQQRTRRAQYRISVSKMLARIRQHIFAVDTQGGNRMRESCTYGSVRGALSNERPYRDGCNCCTCSRPVLCRFLAAGNDDLTTRSGGRRPKSAKARNRGDG